LKKFKIYKLRGKVAFSVNYAKLHNTKNDVYLQPRITSKDVKMHNEIINHWLVDPITYDNTGLPGIIWCIIGGDHKFEPRIKVSYDDNCIHYNDAPTITINGRIRIIGKHNLSFKQFKHIKKWITINKKLLNDYWNEKIDTWDFFNKLQKV
jgi:hypothetical protein